MTKSKPSVTGAISVLSRISDGTVMATLAVMLVVLLLPMTPWLLAVVIFSNASAPEVKPMLKLFVPEELYSAL